MSERHHRTIMREAIDATREVTRLERLLAQAKATLADLHLAGRIKVTPRRGTRAMHPSTQAGGTR